MKLSRKFVKLAMEVDEFRMTFISTSSTMEFFAEDLASFTYKFCWTILPCHFFFIVVDAYSKWPDIFEMRSTTSTATISTLRTLFVRQGIPVEIVSDNGPQFRSEEFRQFMESNHIYHITSFQFHPRTNGQAEKFVNSFKKAIKSASEDSACINKKLI